MEQLFETARKASDKKGPGNKTPGRRLSWTLRFVRVLFNLALVFVVGVLVVASGLYAYVLYVLNESGDPSGAVASVEAQNGA